MMERSEAPAEAAAVAKPDRNQCPANRAGFSPTASACFFTSSATAPAESRVGAILPWRLMGRNSTTVALFSTSDIKKPPLYKLQRSRPVLDNCKYFPMHHKNTYDAFMAALVPAPLVSVSKHEQADSDAQLVELWLHGRTGHTKAAYGRDVTQFFQFVAKPLAQIKLLDFQHFVDSLQGAIASKRRVIASLKSLFGFAMKIGYLQFNVAGAIRSPKSVDSLSEHILAEAAVHRMIALAGNRRNQMLLRVLYGSGVRVSEICPLKWSNAQQNGESGQLTVLGKGSKVRSIVLPVHLWNDLMEFKGDANDDDPIFVSRKHRGVLNRSQVFRIVKAIAKKARVKAPVSPHWFRHCHASHALERGAALNLVQVTLAHASLSTTGRYLHARPNDSSARYLAV